MKAFVLFLVLFASVSFGCEEKEIKSDKGCLTGIPDGLNYRVLIRCCTRAEYAAGSNVNAGGTANWTSYSQHEWKPVDDCGDC